jgi:hypothetical protein
VTGRESGHLGAPPHREISQPVAVPPSPVSDDRVETTETNPDAPEIVSGRDHEKIEGWIPELATETELRDALEKAFDYRGDVTITRKDGTRVAGYIFDRRNGPTLDASVVRLIPQNSPQKISIPYSDIAALAFTGRDTAAGKSWEAWVRKYWEKKAAGEKGIALEPETLE